MKLIIIWQCHFAKYRNRDLDNRQQARAPVYSILTLALEADSAQREPRSARPSH